MDLKRLRHFVTLVDAGTFARAAEELHITQSALSHSMRTLEEQAGVILLERDRHGARPTRAGTLLADEARAMLRKAADLRHNLRVVAESEATEVRFGMAPLPATLWLTDLLGHLLDARADLLTSATVGNGSELLGLLRREAIDFLVCARQGLPDEDGVDITVIGALPLGLIVRADHPLCGKTRPVAADLKPFPLLCMSTSFLSRESGEPAPLFRGGQVAVQADDYGILIDLTLGTDAILLASSHLAAKRPEELRILPVGIGELREALTLVLVTPRGRLLSTAAKEVIAQLRSVIARGLGE